MYRAFVATLFLLFVSVGTAPAADLGSRDEAKALAEAAAAHVKAVGLKQALADFTQPDPRWIDRDLYVLAIDRAGTFVAHGTTKTIVGRNLSELRDVDGRTFVKDMVAIADRGWVDYKWKNPATGAVSPKSTYIIRVGDHSVGVGAYAD